MATTTVLVDRRTRPAVVAAMAGAVLLDLDKRVEHFFRRKLFPRVVQRRHGGRAGSAGSGWGPVEEVLDGPTLGLFNLIMTKRTGWSAYGLLADGGLRRAGHGGRDPDCSACSSL